MRIITVIDDPRVMEKILRHLGALTTRPPQKPTLPATLGSYTYKPRNDVDPTRDYKDVLTD